MKGKYLSISMGVVLIFIAIVLYYIVSSMYLGIFPIGIITGGCILVQMTMLFLCCKNISMNGYKFKSVIAIVIEIFSIIGMGYFFIVWLMFI